MNWLTTAWTVAKGILPSVSSILPVAALAFALGSALGFWAGWKAGTGDCNSTRAESLERLANQYAKIHGQDIEILQWHHDEQKQLDQIKRKAHEILNGMDIPDCSLPSDGLRAIQDVYSGSTSRAGGAVATVRAIESAKNRDTTGNK